VYVQCAGYVVQTYGRLHDAIVTSNEGVEVVGSSDIRMSLPTILVSLWVILTNSWVCLGLGWALTFTLFLLVLSDPLLIEASKASLGAL
jgi:hypothetical protein